MSTDAAMSGAGNIVSVPIANIRRNPTMQVRAKLHPGTITKYATQYRNRIDLGPVAVASVDDALYLLDGWHRLAALERNGWADVDAVIVAATSLAEAGWLAARANGAHGLPLKRKELRNVFRAYMKARQYLQKGGRKLKPLREIAEELGGTNPHTTVYHWMKKDFPSIARRYSGRDQSRRKDSDTPGTEANGLKDAALAAVRQVLAAAGGVTDELERGEIIAGLTEALDVVTKAAPFQVPPKPDF